MQHLSIAVCQMEVSEDKLANIQKANTMVREAIQQPVDMVILPEMFNTPYQANLFPKYAEEYPGPTTDFLSRLARDCGIYLIGGSIAEKGADGNFYNTSYIFNSNGDLIGKHRKMHLFDSDIPGKMTFRESETLTPGNTIEIMEINSVRFAVMICYDCRFPELARIAALKGAQFLVIPAAFNLTSGPAFWELMMRARAVDNQVYTIGAAPARNPEASYQAWGHSMVVNPWGTIVTQADENEEIIYARLDFSFLKKVRNQQPLWKQRRTDLYDLKYNL